MANRLSDRIRETPPCHRCRKSEGLWLVDERTGAVRIGTRCWCAKGKLLYIADEAYKKRQALLVSA